MAQNNNNNNNEDSRGDDDDNVPTSSTSPSPPLPPSFSLTAFTLDDTVTAALTKQLGIPRSHLQVGWANLVHYASKDVRTLVLHRRVPTKGWSDLQIQNLLFTLSTLDTNAKSTGSKINEFWCGVGEREGRCYSMLVQN